MKNNNNNKVKRIKSALGRQFELSKTITADELARRAFENYLRGEGKNNNNVDNCNNNNSKPK